MRIRLVHVTRFDYSADVVEGVMEVRLGPLSDSTQRWDRFQLSVSPSGSVRQFVDAKIIPVATELEHRDEYPSARAAGPPAPAPAPSYPGVTIVMRR